MSKETKVNVLISCMNQKDKSIIERTNIQTDVVVVNQCDSNEVIEYDFQNLKGEKCHAKFINTTERGLSRSRNMAIKNAWGDICLICDDDELLEDDYEDRILNSFNNHPNEHILLFVVERRDIPEGKVYPLKEKKVNFIQILQSSSVQVSFKLNNINKNELFFDEKLGSGTGNGGGEDNKFLLDCKKKKLSIFYVPVKIGAVMPGKSTWFKGYDRQYMINEGWVSRRSLGTTIGFFYILLFSIKHYKLYHKEMSLLKAYKYLFHGFLEKR